jgi:hypothetical protein
LLRVGSISCPADIGHRFGRWIIDTAELAPIISSDRAGVDFGLDAIQDLVNNMIMQKYILLLKMRTVFA